MKPQYFVYKKQPRGEGGRGGEGLVNLSLPKQGIRYVWMGYFLGAYEHRIPKGFVNVYHLDLLGWSHRDPLWNLTEIPPFPIQNIYHISGCCVFMVATLNLLQVLKKMTNSSLHMESIRRHCFEYYNYLIKNFFV